MTAILTRYESDEQYRQRIHNDLQRNSNLITRKTGHQPRVMVWPYGVYNRITIDIARELGIPVTMTLEEDEGKINTQNLSSVNRLLIGHNTTLTNFVWQINEYYKPKTQPMRTVFLDLNEIYDPNPKKQEENLSRILDQVKALNANTVYLQAFTDTDDNGSADTLYFPNRHLPVRADLFSRVSWQLRTRTGVKVYAWLPVFAYDRPNDPLLSFPNQKTLDVVSDIYEDLSKYTHIDGDALLDANATGWIEMNLKVFIVILLSIAVIIVSFLLWIEYNILLYRHTNDGKKKSNIIQHHELARYFKVNPNNLANWHRSEQLTIQLTEQGSIHRIKV